MLSIHVVLCWSMPPNITNYFRHDSVVHVVCGREVEGSSTDAVLQYLLHLELFVLLPEGIAHAPLESTVARLRRQNTNVHPRSVTLEALGASHE